MNDQDAQDVADIRRTITATNADQVVSICSVHASLHRVSGLADDSLPLIDAGWYCSAAILAESMLYSTAGLGFLLRSVETFERTNDVLVLYGRMTEGVLGAAERRAILSLCMC